MLIVTLDGHQKLVILERNKLDIVLHGDNMDWDHIVRLVDVNTGLRLCLARGNSFRYDMETQDGGGVVLVDGLAVFFLIKEDD